MSAFLETMIARAKADKQTIVLPEGNDERTLAAAEQILADDLADLIILGSPDQIAGAGLDVLEQEPMAKDNPLAQIKDSTKLIITPHMAWASLESRTHLVEEVAKNIEAFLAGENRNVVNL